MPGEAVATLLRPEILTAAYARQQTPVSFPLTEAFFTNPIDVDGEEYELIFDPEEMAPMTLNHPGAEARVVSVGELTKRTAVLMYAFNKLPLPEVIMNALQEPDSFALQNMGRTELTRRLNRFSLRHRIMQELAIAKIMFTGKIHSRNSDGAILEAASATATTFDFGVPAGNQGNIGGIVSALWSVAGTDIPLQIEAIKDYARQNGMAEPTDIWINAKNLQYLRKNTQFITWAANNEGLATSIVRGGMIEGLWGMNWHFIGGYYKAADGTKKPYVPLDTALFTPPTGPWLQASRGSTIIPKQIGVVADLDEALRNTLKVYGEFSYAKLNDDPYQLLLLMGNKFGLHFADPNAVFQATVFPAA